MVKMSLIGAGAALLPLILLIVGFAVNCVYYMKSNGDGVIYSAITIERTLGTYLQVHTKVSSPVTSTAESTTHMDQVCGDSSSHNDNCCRCIKTSFSFAIIGMVTNVLLILAFAVPHSRAVANRMLPLVFTAVLIVVDVIAWAVYVGGCTKLVEDINKQVGNGYDDLKLSTSFYLMVFASAACLLPLYPAYVFISEEDKPEEPEEPQEVVEMEEPVPEPDRLTGRSCC